MLIYNICNLKQNYNKNKLDGYKKHYKAINKEKNKFYKH